MRILKASVKARLFVFCIVMQSCFVHSLDFEKTERLTQQSVDSWQDATCYVAGSTLGGYVFGALSKNYERQFGRIEEQQHNNNSLPSNESLMVGFGAGLASLAAIGCLRYAGKNVVYGNVIVPFLFTLDSFCKIGQSGILPSFARSVESCLMPLCACAGVYLKKWYNE